MAGKDEGSELPGTIAVYGFLIFMGGLFIQAFWNWIVAVLFYAVLLGIAYLVLPKDMPDA